MRFLIVLACLCIIADAVSAQDMPACSPDTSIIDSSGVIFPRPFIEGDSINRGIEKIACINTPYEFVFTIVIPDAAMVGIFNLELSGARIDTVGAIDSLPIGVSYFCDPGDCELTALEPGCLILTGVPTSENEPGRYNLTINFSLLSNIGSIGASFPSDQFPGNYFLTLEPEGSENCNQIVSVQKKYQSGILAFNAPNPFSHETTLYFNVQNHQEMELLITDMMGKRIHTQKVYLQEGVNPIPFDASHLPPGTYIYTLHNGLEHTSQKMVVTRN